MTDFATIILFISDGFRNIFDIMDSVDVLDTGYTILDFGLAYIAFNMLLDFYYAWIGANDDDYDN